MTFPLTRTFSFSFVFMASKKASYQGWAFQAFIRFDYHRELFNNKMNSHCSFYQVPHLLCKVIVHLCYASLVLIKFALDPSFVCHIKALHRDFRYPTVTIVFFGSKFHRTTKALLQPGSTDFREVTVNICLLYSRALVKITERLL